MIKVLGKRDLYYLLSRLEATVIKVVWYWYKNKYSGTNRKFRNSHDI